MSDDTVLPKLAFLGPVGTYTHQAAYDRFGTSVEYCEQKTITDVFNAVSSDTPLALIPQENSTYGAVIETDDLLRLPTTGKDIFVVGETTLSIQHCLLVRKGVQFQQIENILSHEQALGQCRDFISTNIPGASVVKMPSTSAAAQALLLPPTENRDPFKCAAICSSIVATVFDGLEILREGIQDAEANFTRFYILSTTLAFEHIPPPKDGPPKHALVRLSSSGMATSVDMHSAPTITQLLIALKLSAIRIDRRPSSYPVPFHDVYLVELQQNLKDGDTEKGLHKVIEPHWISEVKAGLDRVKDIGGEAILLGVW